MHVAGLEPTVSDVESGALSFAPKSWLSTQLNFIWGRFFPPCYHTLVSFLVQYKADIFEISKGTWGIVKTILIGIKTLFHEPN